MSQSTDRPANEASAAKRPRPAPRSASATPPSNEAGALLEALRRSPLVGVELHLIWEAADGHPVEL
jgi:limonene-1,2-epoxide hydrolase